ncbi:hypothetical protein LCGC14_2945850, partial [marine sediment metagenome]
MDVNRWLGQLRVELVNRRLPPPYVERVVLELSDHVTDFMEDRMSTDAKDLHGVFDRLGAPGQVADSAAKEYRPGRFSRRYPLLMFVFLPVLSLPVLWVGYVLCVLLTVKSLGLESGSIDTGTAVWQWANACAPFFVIGMLVVPVGLTAALFCRLARKAGVSLKWTIVACFVLALLGGLATSQFLLPTETTQGQLTVGFGLGLHPSALQMLQFLLPLAIGGWAVWRQMKGRVVQA